MASTAMKQFSDAIAPLGANSPPVSLGLDLVGGSDGLLRGRNDPVPDALQHSPMSETVIAVSLRRRKPQGCQAAVTSNQLVQNPAQAIGRRMASRPLRARLCSLGQRPSSTLKLSPSEATGVISEEWSLRPRMTVVAQTTSSFSLLAGEKSMPSFTWNGRASQGCFAILTGSSPSYASTTATRARSRSNWRVKSRNGSSGGYPSHRASRRDATVSSASMMSAGIAPKVGR